MLEFRAGGQGRGFPASLTLDRTSGTLLRVVPELQSFFVFVVLARGVRRRSTGLLVVVFRAILAAVRIIRAVPELVALQKGQSCCPFPIYVRLNPRAQVKIGVLMQIETKLREVRW